MKVKMEIDCTPEEARAFLGLPDVAPLQQRLLAETETRMRDSLEAVSSQQLVDQLLPFSGRGIEQWQQMWMEMAAKAAGGGKPGTEKGRER